MTKICMFAGDDALTLQNHVNNFIKDKKVIDIKYQSCVYSSEFRSNGTPANIHVNDRIIVIYEEDTE